MFVRNNNSKKREREKRNVMKIKEEKKNTIKIIVDYVLCNI